MGQAAVASALITLGCEPSSPPPPRPPVASLVELDAWVRVEDVGQDVFGAERPPGEICDPILGIGTEIFGPDEVLEISTDFCNYATVQQPSLEALLPGDTVAIRAWHYELTASDPGQAHLALAIDGAVAWEVQVPVPAEGDFVEGEIAIDREIPAGVDLQFHVHNHGANSYDLLSLEVVTEDAATGGEASG